MKLTLLSVLFLAATLHAQTAKVIPLSPEDAALAKSLHDQKETLDKKIADFNFAIEKKHIRVAGREGSFTYRPGWGYWGRFEYSDDYKFIVPAQLTPDPRSPGFTCPSWVYGGNTLTDGRNWFVAN